jgi:hypothetical protein
MKKAAGETPAAFMKRVTEAVLLAVGHVFRSVLGLRSGVGCILGSVGSSVGTGGVGGGSSGVSRSGGSVGSRSSGVGSSLGGVSGHLVASGGGGGGSVGRFGSSGRGGGSSVVSLLGVGAGSQGKAHSQGKQRLVESHGVSLVVGNIGNAQLRAGNMMTSRLRVSSGWPSFF